MNAKEIIQDLDRRRAAIHMRITSLTDKIGVTPMTYRRWRAGETAPDYDTLMAMRQIIEDAEVAIAVLDSTRKAS